jgi:hypothetical protein
MIVDAKLRGRGLGRATIVIEKTTPATVIIDPASVESTSWPPSAFTL